MSFDHPSIAGSSGLTAFVFAGGGSLGAIEVGMLRELLDRGVRPDCVIGASAGAINAAYFAGRPNAEGVAKLDQILALHAEEAASHLLGLGFGRIGDDKKVGHGGCLSRGCGSLEGHERRGGAGQATSEGRSQP